ncbi:DUF881 domain-containing protein [Acidaminobacter sp. JC074]|uniref:DUF881 domain-containing protein n=1 Tax=Acidaminobacter sp. JC074 TaxID=2530199 RepID=UPI001F0D8B1C|nr:DUF881 domain-containing protein [Acidaminobacter sp. JC074]MCH4890223.1 DUF881 domain-containing protein [Acidaminobacter sp. JC074]
MKIKNQIAIGIVCVALGIILALQYKIFQDSLAGGDSLFKKQTDLTNELFILKEEKQQLLVELDAARTTLLEIEESASKDNAIIKNLTDTIREYEILAGMTDVSGQGIVVTIDNPPADQNTTDISVVNYYDEVLKLVNDLNAAGAEAISINEQRVIAISEIRAAGNSINVNFVPQTTPLVIKAIGKKDALEGALTFRYGQVTRLREANLLVDVKVLDEVIIPRYHGLINFEYVETIKGE